MRNGTNIGLNLGSNWMPCNLSSYWGAEQDRKDFAIRRAQSEESTRLYEALINSDVRTRFCRRMMSILLEAADAIMYLRRNRRLTRAEEKELDGLLAIRRYYEDRFHYFLDKMDRSAEAELSRHFWYYDDDTEEVVDADTGKRYKA